MMMNNLIPSEISALFQQSLRQCSLQSTAEARCAVASYAKEKPVRPFSFGSLWGKYTWRDAQKTLVGLASFFREELSPHANHQDVQGFHNLADNLTYIASGLEQYAEGYLPSKWCDYLLDVGNMMVNASRRLRTTSVTDPTLQRYLSFTDKLIKVLHWAHLLDDASDANDKEANDSDAKASRQDKGKKTQQNVQNRIKELEAQLGDQNPHFCVTPYDNHTDYWQELDKLIGMDNVKKQLQDLVADYHLQMARKAQHPDLKVEPVFHSLYLGNPGTGKTTVARLVSGILRQEGLIAGGHYLEVGSQDLISPYVGMSAKVAELACLYCIDGLLFIDEAYAFGNNKGANSDVGAAVVDTLTQLIENHRDRLCIVLAGYEDEMAAFLDQTNPGFVSRFNHVVYFEDFNAEEMTEIFLLNISERYYRIESNCISVVKDIFDIMIEKKDEYSGFANARTVRLFTDVVVSRASQRMHRERAEGQRVDLDLLVIEDFMLSDEDMQRVLGLM